MTLEIKTSAEIEKDLVSAQEHGMEDGGILAKELSKKKWISLEVHIESVTKLIKHVQEELSNIEGELDNPLEELNELKALLN